VLVKGADDCVMPRVTAGSLNIVDSTIRASSNTANAVTASVGTVVTLMNNQIVTPASDTVARVSIAGYHSIISVVYDKANSTLSNSLNSVGYFQTVNVDSLVSSGVVNPQKGLLLSPNVLSGITTTLNIDIANNSLYYFKTNATTTINLSGFATGKIVEVWLTNTDTGGGSNHTITHGCLANNSTIGATSFTLSSLHSAYLKYFSIDGDLANTFVSVNYS
jgi:hypothetical protein